MIQVTRLDGSTMHVNVDLIKWIEQTPDTLIAMTNGEKMLVRETPDVLLERTIAFKRAVTQGPASVRPFVPRRGAAGLEEAL